MKDSIIWWLFKQLCLRTPLVKTLKKLNGAEIEEFKNKAISEEEFEIAAILEYHAKFKSSC